jgi:hypothetical protein
MAYVIAQWNFLIQWTVVVVGFAVHATLDRSPLRHTRGRVFELAALWVLVGIGASILWGALGHIGPTSHATAASIGYVPSMFQWEVGWADLAFGLLGVLCARRENRGGWTNATLVAWTIFLYGCGIGHIMQWVAHDNTTPNNVWSIPTCFLAPPLGALLVHLARRHGAYTAQPSQPVVV